MEGESLYADNGGDLGVGCRIGGGPGRADRQANTRKKTKHSGLSVLERRESHLRAASGGQLSTGLKN